MNQPALNNLDAAIWHTIDINAAIDQNNLDSRPVLTTAFPVFDGERVLSQGTFTLYDFRALGDGTYAHNSGFFYASGGFGAALTLGAAAGRMAGNSRRKREAQAAAIPRWTPIDTGYLHVTTHRACFQTSTNFFTWDYGSMTTVQLVGCTQMQFTGSTDDGRQICWIVDSVWAALLFTIWARRCHVQHPQFVSRVWIPQGWYERARASSYGLPRGSS
ncbi:hypothetical protein [Luteipulveratus halotolerans]|uniref:Uncharacterized protein n=1 Tax=Luteipulveratus halotolerans TaxID=1631356 RepID=A0A0L6CMH7_9MICO|nr:hypothetical protein [Luteipulveratus halotolerans]KNX38860.1 hypothetical protein VV01_19740 [Luteipulveratus halotolerans]